MTSAHRDWLRLCRTENVGPVTFHQLLQRFGTPEAALEAIPRLAARGGRMATLRIPTGADIDAELTAGDRCGARLLISTDHAYPKMLRSLSAPPPVVWIKGHDHLLNTPAVGIVGSRNASAAGQKLARDLAMGLGAAGKVVVSGLARGIDTVAHVGSLKTGTIAVLGGGIDHIYPQENADLYHEIATTGCLISDSPVGHTAQARDFPRRNRIIAGLGQGLVVIEAAHKSGTLITATLAADMGREVMAVPGSPLDPRARGTNNLLRQGATLVETVEDILEALAHAQSLAQLQGSLDLGEPGTDEFSAHGLDTAPMETEIDALRPRLLAQLSPTPIGRDDLARSLGVSVALVNATLLELELAGQAESQPGGLVAMGFDARAETVV